MAARLKRQKIDHSSTAAYAASQPLFDALRNASSQAETQKSHLSNARDVVQSLHVKIASADSHNDIARHEAYMDAVLRSYRLAMDSYCAVFQELVSITKEDPSEGREAGKRHVEFVGMLDTAERARALAASFDVAKDIPERSPAESSAKSEEDSSDAIEVDNEEEDAEPGQTPNGVGKRPLADATGSFSQGEKPSQLAADIRYDTTGKTLLWQNGELKVPYDTLSQTEKMAWAVVRKRLKRKARNANKKAKKAKSSDPAAVFTQPNAGPSPHVLPPAVEYEDVSAEVEARLKAKAEKKRAEKAKSEKKRKRDSGDSFATVPETKDDDDDPLAALEESLAPSAGASKPAKKKPRKDGEIHGGNGKRETKLVVKRKKAPEGEANGDEGMDMGQASKKRKKGKS